MGGSVTESSYKGNQSKCRFRGLPGPPHGPHQCGRELGFLTSLQQIRAHPSLRRTSQ